MAGRRLSFEEREEIAWRRDRKPSTTSSLQQPLDTSDPVVGYAPVLSWIIRPAKLCRAGWLWQRAARNRPAATTMAGPRQEDHGVRLKYDIGSQFQ